MPVIIGPPPPLPDFALTSTVSASSGNAADGYFTLTNNSDEWVITGLTVSGDSVNTPSFAATSGLSNWGASFSGSGIGNFSYYLTGSGIGNALGQGSYSDFLWEVNGGVQFPEPPFDVVFTDINGGPSLTCSGSLDSLNGGAGSCSAPVPEPSSLPALGLGLLALGLYSAFGSRRRAGAYVIKSWRVTFTD